MYWDGCICCAWDVNCLKSNPAALSSLNLISIQGLPSRAASIGIFIYMASGVIRASMSPTE